MVMVTVTGMVMVMVRVTDMVIYGDSYGDGQSWCEGTHKMIAQRAPTVANLECTDFDEIAPAMTSIT